MKQIAFTIIKANYLAQAQILYKSAQKYLPELDFYIYLLDCEREEIEEIKTFSLSQKISPPDIFWTKLRFKNEIKRINVDDYFQKYNSTEFCTSVKPSIFLELITEFGQNYFYSYFDPDIEFFSDCQNFFKKAAEHSFWLIPHFLTPPEDNYQPSSIDILASGNYNFGYLGINPTYPESLKGLYWWERQLKNKCVINLPSQIFVDQKWGSLFANYPHSGICYAPEYNVGYWNLHERYLTKKDLNFEIAGKGLGFFHFSGFDPLQPISISKHQNRFKLEALPTAYKRLFQSYASKLIGHGYQIWQNFKSTDKQNFFRQILSTERIIWPNLYKSPDKIKKMPSYKAIFWLTLLSLRKHCQIIIAIWRDRKQPYFRQAIIKRYSSYLIRGLRLVKFLFEREIKSISPPKKEKSIYHLGRFGVIGFFSGEFGIGESSRNIAKLILSMDPNCLLYDVSKRFYPQFKDNESLKKYLVEFHENDQVEYLVLAVNADRVNQIIALGFSPLFARAKKKIGYWWWETESFPDYWVYLSFYFDEIWVGTSFVKKSLEKILPVPVKIVPLPVVDKTKLSRKKPSLSLDSEEKYLLTIFDGNSFLERKNPWATIKAFKLAFDELGKKSKIHLIIKTINVRPDDEELMKKELVGYPSTLVNQSYTEEEMNYLIDRAWVFISLHRSEGLGLNIINAMLFEKPVIVTNYSGNLDFNTKNNSYLIDGPLVTATMKAGVYQDSFWCEPDYKQAAQAIIEIIDNPKQAKIKGKQARLDIIKKYKLF